MGLWLSRGPAAPFLVMELYRPFTVGVPDLAWNAGSPFGFGAKGSGLVIPFDVDLLATAKLVAGFGNGAVDGDLAVVDEQLHAGATDVWKRFGEKGVDAASVKMVSGLMRNIVSRSLD